MTESNLEPGGNRTRFIWTLILNLDHTFFQNIPYLPAQKVAKSGIGNFNHLDEFWENRVARNGKERNIGEIIGNRHGAEGHHTRTISATAYASWKKIDNKSTEVNSEQK